MSRYNVSRKGYSIRDYNCKSCGETDPSKFYGARKTECKACHNKRCVDKRKAVLKEAREKLGNKCCKCGYNKCEAALEFHHTDPNEKDFVLAGAKYGKEKMLKELEKCILVCANCHREIHANERE